MTPEEAATIVRCRGCGRPFTRARLSDLRLCDVCARARLVRLGHIDPRDMEYALR